MTPREITHIDPATGTLKYVLTGKGKPVVIFLSGHNIPLSNWKEVIEKLPCSLACLTYDRPAHSKGPRPSEPQTGAVISDSLDQLTKDLGLTPPFIIVAHSLGGLFANMYSRKYPEKVAGVVFVESGHPEEAGQLALDRKGLLGWFASKIAGAATHHPNSEHSNLQTTIKQINSVGPFPQIPIRVITGILKMPFVPHAQHEFHQKKQIELLELSTKSQQILATKSGHAPQISEPGLVARVVMELYAELKTKSIVNEE